MISQKVARSGPFVKNWTYIYSRSTVNRDEIQKTVPKFSNFLTNNMGIGIERGPSPAPGFAAGFGIGNELDMKRAFEQVRKQGSRFVLVVLPSKSAPDYNIVKKMADVDFGILTVCVVEEAFLRPKGQLGYFANVGLKVNLKFGGVNHTLKDETGLIKSGKTMVVGYDVTHPTNLAPDAAENLPSIVGLVASRDKELGQWPAVSWNNPGGQEMLGHEFTTRFQSRLQLWLDTNKSLPQNIVIFRDGVSEGQFRTVLEVELPLIRKACEIMYHRASAKIPRISLIVSVKRHHTRFYPTDPNHSHRGSKSPKEGTVVDRGVTNVRYWDFFLQAHAAIKGKELIHSPPPLIFTPPRPPLPPQTRFLSLVPQL